MADRADLLERLCVALARPGVSGVLGTADVLEDLLLLGALDGKVVIGSMNRGGLAGTRLRDRRPVHRVRRRGHRADGLRRRQDAAPDRPRRPGHRRHHAGLRPGRVRAGRPQLMAMVEPFMSHRADGRVRNDLSPEAMIRAVAVASGLGTTSAYTWLKVPVVADMEQVMAATTLPAAAARRRGARTTRRRRSPAGRRRCGCLTSGGSWPGGRCCTRPTATWPPPWTPRSACCEGRPVTPAAPPGLAAGPWRARVTPDQAGWSYSGLRVLALPPGGSQAFGTAADEMLVLPLAGSCAVDCDGRAVRPGRPGQRVRRRDRLRLPAAGRPARMLQRGRAGGSRCPAPGPGRRPGRRGTASGRRPGRAARRRATAPAR